MCTVVTYQFLPSYWQPAQQRRAGANERYSSVACPLAIRHTLICARPILLYFVLLLAVIAFDVSFMSHASSHDSYFPRSPNVAKAPESPSASEPNGPSPSSTSLTSVPLRVPAKGATLLTSPLEFQLSESDSVFAANNSDNAGEVNATQPPQPSHLPQKSSQLKESQRPVMATSMITRQTQHLPRHKTLDSSPSAPHDIFIYSGSTATTRPTTPQNSQSHLPNGHYSHLFSKGLPEHLIALPPFSSPTESPSVQPSTPTQQSPDTFGSARTGGEERQAYRSWREGKAVYGGRVMGEGHGGEIEKKIEATLPRTEHVVNPRSRKASQYMRIFNQGSDSVNEQSPHARVPPSVKESGQSIEPGKFLVLWICDEDYHNELLSSFHLASRYTNMIEQLNRYNSNPLHAPRVIHRHSQSLPIQDQCRFQGTSTV